MPVKIFTEDDDDILTQKVEEWIGNNLDKKVGGMKIERAIGNYGESTITIFYESPDNV